LLITNRRRLCAWGVSINVYREKGWLLPRSSDEDAGTGGIFVTLKQHVKHLVRFKDGQTIPELVVGKRVQ
jgi:hypothetical protein